MQDNKENELPPHQQERRATAEQIKDIQDTLHRVLDNFTAAFPKDEDGRPDFYGHREFHKLEDDKRKKLTEYQNEFTKRLVISIAASTAGVVGLTTTGLGEMLVQFIKSR